jgi:hypothetical protein
MVPPYFAVFAVLLLTQDTYHTFDEICMVPPCSAVLAMLTPSRGR